MDTVGQDAFGPQTFPTFAAMQGVRRWLIAAPDKVPHYAAGTKRHGTLDTPADWQQLVSYDEARAARDARGEGWMLGFALGPDSTGGHWQGIDLDGVQQNQLSDFANGAPGYVEVSPSGQGAHAIGYGRSFATLGANGSGIEAYAAGRYFTVTEHPIRDSGTVCLASYVEQTLAPRHGAARVTSAGTVETVPVDAKTVTELRSALMHMPADEYHLWVRVGIALRELGATGRGLWLEWSATSEKFDSKQAARKWETFNPTDTDFKAVFAEAQRQGWVNPVSNAAQIAAPAKPPAETPEQMLERMRVLWTDGAEELPPDIVEGLVADRDVTLLGGHGGIGKSFLALQMACAVAEGKQVLQQETRQQRVLYYAAEDPRWRLGPRLRKIASKFAHDQTALDRNLCVLDASEVDPLYGETWEDMGNGEKPFMVKMLGGTDYFANLQRMVKAFDPQLVVIDGASDTFDGSEIARREVRAFIKLLRAVHPERKVGVLLMVHIDRNSARGNTTTDDGYAGNTQWHNSCRRRLWLQAETEKDDDTRAMVQTGTFVLRVMKHQDGKPLDDMQVTNHDGGVWELAATFGGALAGEDPADQRQVIAQLIQEHYDRGDWITTSMAPNAPTGAHASLKGDPRWPRKLKKASQTNEVLRDMLRDGVLGKEPFQKPDRHWGERWHVLRDPSQPFERPAGSADSGGE